MLAASLALVPLGARAAPVVDSGPVDIYLGGDVKGFFVSLFPYEHPGLSLLFGDGPQGQGALDVRLKLEGRVAEWLSFGIHHQLEARSPTSAGLSGSAAPGQVGRAMPEAVDLSWEAARRAGEGGEHCSGAGHQVCGRVDRLFVKLRLPHVDVTVGRQAISFGTTFFFTPMDLVAPFSPTTIDREYKPGVDAIRADAYLGTAGNLSLVAAYAGSWDLPGLVLVGRGGLTVDVWDLGLFLGAVHEDMVVGLDAAGSAGDFGLRAELTVTRPRGGGSAFLRAVVGADRRFDFGLQVSGELYAQTLGAMDSKGMLAFAASERVARGELWALGRYYAALSATYELHPLVRAGAFGVVNLRDPSALVGPSLTWSAAENTEVDVGAYLGLGRRPPEGFPVLDTDLGSEFGFAPVTAFAALKTYF